MEKNTIHKLSANNATPYVVAHPGEIIKDELEYRGISQRQFAKEIGVSYSLFNEVLNAKRQLTPELALLVEVMLGVNAAPLLEIQMDYNLHKAKSNPTFMERLESLRRIAAVF